MPHSSHTRTPPADTRSAFTFRTARAALAGLAVCGALTLSGCVLTLSPPEHRARQYSNQFSTYSEPVRVRLREATIAVGDDRTAVYIALGTPQKRLIGYDRDEDSGFVIPLEFWEYSGYPSGDTEGRFVTLNNGGFAPPLGLSPYGKITVEFANSHVRSFSFNPDKNAQGGHNRSMKVPSNPH